MTDFAALVMQLYKSIGVAEGGSGGSAEPPLGGSDRARNRRPELFAAYV